MVSRGAFIAIPAALILAATGSLVLAWAAKPRLWRAVESDYTTICVTYAKPRYKAIGLSGVDQPGAAWSLITNEPVVVSHRDLQHARERWPTTKGPWYGHPDTQ